MERKPRERAGGVREVPIHPEFGASVRPDPDGQESGRGREARPVRSDTMDVAQEPGELGEEGSSEVGIDGLGTVRDGHCL